jgi:hypothetical protein
VYTPYSRHGTIRQQDIQACNIARSAIAKSLALEARRTAVLVSALIHNITANLLAPKPIEDLWKHIENDATLRQIRSRTDANVDDFCQFAGWVKGARRQLASDEKNRMDKEIGFRIYTYVHFGPWSRLTRLHLIPA